MPKPVVSTEPSSHPLIPATSPRSQPTDPALSSLSAGRGPQHVPESAQGQGQPDTAGHHGTTPSADSNQAPVSPLGRAPWLFQKGNRYGQRRKPHKGGMAKYIQEQTMSGSMIVEFWLALACGQPFPMKRIVRLSMTSAQYAVAVGKPCNFRGVRTTGSNPPTFIRDRRKSIDRQRPGARCRFVFRRER